MKLWYMPCVWTLILVYHIRRGDAQGLGSPCMTEEAEMSCRINQNADCDLSLATCICREGYRQDGGTDNCMMAAINEDCTSPINALACDSPHAHFVCEASTFVCKCADGYFQDIDDYSCAENPVSLGDNCAGILVNHCENQVTNGRCSGGMCVCNPGFSGSTGSKTCARGTNCGEAFNTQACDVITHGSCGAGLVCECADGYYGSDGTQTCDVGLGTSCLDSAAHTSCGKINDALCSNGVCVCNIGYTREGIQNRCKLSAVDDKCDSPINALACDKASANFECAPSSISCKCADGYTGSTGDTDCKETSVSLEDACAGILAENCENQVTNGRCSSEVCVCAPGFNGGTGTKTCAPAGIGSTCGGSVNTQACDAITHGVCGAGLACVCTDGYYGSEGTQTCDVGLGTSCLGSAAQTSCGKINDALCSSDVCVCNIGYTREGIQNRCKLSAVDDDCNSPINALACDKASANFVCAPSSTSCKCADGYTGSTGDTGCTATSVNLGDACAGILANHCENQVTNGRCSGGMCVCGAGFSGNTGTKTCAPAVVDVSCSSPINALACDKPSANFVCAPSTFTCRCANGYIGSTGDPGCTEPSVSLGDACFGILSITCANQVTNGECVEEECVCSLGFSGNTGTKTCARANHGADCTAPVNTLACDFAASNFVCGFYSNKCECASGYTGSEGAADCIAAVNT